MVLMAPEACRVASIWPLSSVLLMQPDAPKRRTGKSRAPAWCQSRRLAIPGARVSLEGRRIAARPLLITVLAPLSQFLPRRDVGLEGRRWLPLVAVLVGQNRA